MEATRVSCVVITVMSARTELFRGNDDVKVVQSHLNNIRQVHMIPP